MSQANELLDSLTNEEISAYTASQATEEHIFIGQDRFIKVPESLKRIAVQFDHDVETVTFDCPRYWDDIDMSTMHVYINYMLKDGTLGSYLADNVRVDSSDSSMMHFDWTISRNVTYLKGEISFLICIKKSDTNGVEQNHWNSELNRDMYVSEGLECDGVAPSEHIDLIEQILIKLETALNDKTPFYVIEPDSISGLELSGTVYYKESESSYIKKYNYSFDYANYGPGEYCISANRNSVDTEVVTLRLASESTIDIVLAYVDNLNEDGLFDNFHVVGDRYIDNKFVGVNERFNDAAIQTQHYISQHNQASDAHENRFSVFQPYLKIEPDVVEGATISGKAYYRNASDSGKIKIKEYSFSTDNRSHNSYYMVAGLGENDEAVFSLVYYPDYATSFVNQIVAYVTIENGVFTNFQLVGDGYLKEYINDNVNSKVAYYQLEPDSTSGNSISGKVSYRDVDDGSIKNITYSFSVGDRTDGNYCLYAFPQMKVSNVVFFGLTSVSDTGSHVILAYVKIENGVFTDFQLAGDGYLKEYADAKLAVAKSLINNHNIVQDAHSDLFSAVRNKVSLLQTHPCYEYSTSGGNVQRFDDVSEIAHNIGITIHGATDSDGNMVTNPKVSVYGKNLFVFVSSSASGYTVSGSNCKIVNPTANQRYATSSEVMLNPGTYTYSCTVSGEVAYSSTSAFRAFYSHNGTDYTLSMDGYNGKTSTYSATFTVTAPTIFKFGKIWFYGTPTRANLSLDFQLEVGGKMTDYEPYIEVQTARPQTSFGEGEVFKIETFTAESPNMTIIASDDNNLISTVDVVYNADLKCYIDSKISEAIGNALGGDY